MRRHELELEVPRRDDAGDVLLVLTAERNAAGPAVAQRETTGNHVLIEGIHLPVADDVASRLVGGLDEPGKLPRVLQGEHVGIMTRNLARDLAEGVRVRVLDVVGHHPYARAARLTSV